MARLKVYTGSGWEYTGAGEGAMQQLYDNLLSGTAANFDITPISGAFNHLRLLAYLRTDKAGSVEKLNMRFNNDSGAN